MNCPTCNANVDYILAHDCPAIVTPRLGAERSESGFVTCSEWMDEAEAALTHARNALLKAPEWHDNWTAQKEIAIAIRCLETALASEPRPSSIDQTQRTDTAEGAS